MVPEADVELVWLVVIGKRAVQKAWIIGCFLDLHVRSFALEIAVQLGRTEAMYECTRSD